MSEGFHTLLQMRLYILHIHMMAILGPDAMSPRKAKEVFATLKCGSHGI